MNNTRTIISAVNPCRYEDQWGVWLKVWFEELTEPVAFFAIPSDVELHGRELWIRAMAGEYGPVELLPAVEAPAALSRIKVVKPGAVMRLLPRLCCEPTEDNGPIKWR